MRTIALILLFVVLLCASALALFAALPFVKEGSSWGDLPLFAGVSVSAVGLGFLWWLAVGRSFKLALIGWTVLLVPMVVHGSIVASLVLARIEGQRLAKTVEINTYQEQSIFWPGFDGPVGLQITLSLRHAEGINATILPPEIRMGPKLDVSRDKLSASLTSGSGYLKNTYLEEPAGDLTLLKTVLFQKVFENAAAITPTYRFSAASRFANSGTTALTYFLLPGTVDYLPNVNRVCLNSRSFGIPACVGGQTPETGCAAPNAKRKSEPVYAEGHNLSAIWMAAGAYDMTADISEQLSAMMRQHSQLQAKPADWRSIQKRLEPSGLARAGYKLCPAGEDSHTRFRTCYCRSG